jgi:hypothetical protein
MPTRSAFVFVRISEETAIITLHHVNSMVFINEMECVYCAVRIGSFKDPLCFVLEGLINSCNYTWEQYTSGIYMIM